MSLRRPILTLMSALVALAALSCNSLESPEDDDAIAIYLEMDNTTLSEGESMSITITARNVGFMPLVFTGPSDCLLYIEVWNTNGQREYNSASSCSGGTVTEELAVGGEKVTTITWDGNRTGGVRLHGTFLIRPVALVAGGARVGPGVSVLVE